ncbi:ATP-dependent DNA helicase PIF1, partial [Suillus fuscotomentosus]
TVSGRQFPLHAAYATTFNACQGLTLARTALDLRTDPFARGQLYTALSRVRTRRDTLCLFAETNEE